jgi:AcrR family transcriptional regulator
MMSSDQKILPAAPQATRRRPRDRKQQIIRAARDLFVEHGYPNVSMTMIAEAVGVTAGALYRHVETKAELITSVFEDSFAWLDKPHSTASFDLAVEHAISYFVDHPYLPDLWVSEVKYLKSEEQVELRRRMRAYAQHFVVLLARQNPELSEAQRDLISWALISLLSSIGRRLIRKPPASRTEIIRGAVKAIVAVDISNLDEPLAYPERLIQPLSLRERLLRAAFDEFERVGYHETSMAAIGTAAGVTGPNLYSYFASKADVLRAVYDRATHALWLGLDESLARAQDADEALTMLINSYVRLSRHWPRALEEPSGEAELDEFALVAQREYIGEWVALLRRVRPSLAVPEARLRVQIGLLLLADLYQVPHVRESAGIEANAASLVRAVLFS